MLNVDAYDHGEQERELLRLWYAVNRRSTPMSDTISTRYSRKPRNSSETILLEGSLHTCRTRSVSRGNRICPT